LYNPLYQSVEKKSEIEEKQVKWNLNQEKTVSENSNTGTGTEDAISTTIKKVFLPCLLPAAFLYLLNKLRKKI